MSGTKGNLTMDAVITGQGDLRAIADSEGKGVCQAAVDILFALSEEGAKAVEDAMDILHDYRSRQRKTPAFTANTRLPANPL